MPVHDPEVQNAADHALKTIQQRSNSLFPYELQEVSHAKAEVCPPIHPILRLYVVSANSKNHFHFPSSTMRELKTYFLYPK